MMKKALSLALVLTLCITLAACGADKPERIVEKLEAAGYDVQIQDDETLVNSMRQDSGVDGLNRWISSDRVESEDFVYIYYCEDRRAAEQMCAYLEQVFGDWDREIILLVKGKAVYVTSPDGWAIIQ